MPKIYLVVESALAGAMVHVTLATAGFVAVIVAIPQFAIEFLATLRTAELFTFLYCHGHAPGELADHAAVLCVLVDMLFVLYDLLDTLDGHVARIFGSTVQKVRPFHDILFQNHRSPWNPGHYASDMILLPSVLVDVGDSRKDIRKLGGLVRLCSARFG